MEKMNWYFLKRNADGQYVYEKEFISLIIREMHIKMKMIYQSYC